MRRNPEKFAPSFRLRRDDADVMKEAQAGRAPNRFCEIRIDLKRTEVSGT
jgi:hypothetical protein